MGAEIQDFDKSDDRSVVRRAIKHGFEVIDMRGLRVGDFSVGHMLIVKKINGINAMVCKVLSHNIIEYSYVDVALHWEEVTDEIILKSIPKELLIITEILSNNNIDCVTGREEVYTSNYRILNYDCRISIDDCTFDQFKTLYLDDPEFTNKFLNIVSANSQNLKTISI